MISGYTKRENGLGLRAAKNPIRTPLMWARVSQVQIIFQHPEDKQLFGISKTLPPTCFQDVGFLTVINNPFQTIEMDFFLIYGNSMENIGFIWMKRMKTTGT